MASTRVRDNLLLAVAAAVVFFVNLGVPRLWDRDEPRNAGCAREMLERGDWVTPTFNGQLRVEKPALPYWFMIAGYRLFGDTEFAARFFSALLGVGTVLLTAEIGRTLFDRSVGFLAAIVLCTSIMMNVAARAATPDAYLIFFTTAALCVFARWLTVTDHVLTAGDHDGQPPPRRLTLSATVLIYGLLGCAVLCKGPVGVVLPVGIMLGTIAVLPGAVSSEPAAARSRRRRLRAWTLAALRSGPPALGAMRPLLGLVVLLVVAAPWYVSVGVATDGVWLEKFFVGENLQRALQPRENHGGPFVYYLPAIALGFFPWSVFLVPATIDAIRRSRSADRRRGDLFATMWIVVWVGAFSAAGTKLPSYVTPAYPALSLLTARYLTRWLGGTVSVGPRLQVLPLVVFTVSGLLLAIGTVIAARLYLSGYESLAVPGLGLLLAGSGCLWLFRRSRVRDTVRAFAVAAVLFSVGLLGIAPAQVSRAQRSDQLLKVARTTSDRPVLAAVGCHEPSWVYYWRRPIPELQFEEAIAFLSASPDHLLITTDECFAWLDPAVAKNIRVLAREPYFLRDKQLLILAGPLTPDVAAPEPARTAAQGADASTTATSKDVAPRHRGSPRLAN